MNKPIISKRFVASKADLQQAAETLRQDRLTTVEATLRKVFGDAVDTRLGLPWLNDINLRLVAAAIVNDLKGA